jgi:hypothetical protein
MYDTHIEQTNPHRSREMTTKSKMSPTARNILHHFEVEAKGHMRYLTAAMQKALVADAMYYEMLNESVRRPDTPISEYVTAMREVLDVLDLEIDA